jgi:membrane associated rhomboid family serine protease
MKAFGVGLLVTAACLIQATCARSVLGVSPVSHGAFFVRKPSNCIVQPNILELRGGARRKPSQTATLHSSKTATGKKKVKGSVKGDEKKSAISDSLQKYKQILPLTRVYISMVGLVTLMGMVLGEELTQGLFALDPNRVVYGLELWRPVTAACFLGPPSIGWLMSGYYLFQYGSTLERAYGTAQHFVFLSSQIILLTLTSALFGQPFFAPSIITAMLHVLSRSMPHEKVKWLVFTVPYWALPYGLMATDVLQAGSPMAAIPHVFGIFSGHFYYFHKYIWPKIGGQDWLVAPDFLIRRLDPNSNAKQDSKAAVSSALKKRKRGKGHTLGGK